MKKCKGASELRELAAFEEEKIEKSIKHRRQKVSEMKEAADILEKMFPNEAITLSFGLHGNEIRGLHLKEDKVLKDERHIYGSLNTRYVNQCTDIKITDTIRFDDEDGEIIVEGSIGLPKVLLGLNEVEVFWVKVGRVYLKTDYQEASQELCDNFEEKLKELDLTEEKLKEIIEKLKDYMNTY